MFLKTFTWALGVTSAHCVQHRVEALLAKCLNISCCLPHTDQLFFGLEFELPMLKVDLDFLAAAIGLKQEERFAFLGSPDLSGCCGQLALSHIFVIGRPQGGDVRQYCHCGQEFRERKCDVHFGLL